MSGCALAGCGTLFGLQELPDAAPSIITPAQEILAQSQNYGIGPPLVIPVQRTRPGNTLYLVIAIKTGSRHIASVTDNGGNGWLRVLDGPESPLTTGSLRLEMWSSTRTVETDQITIAFVPDVDYRPMAVNFTEWTGELIVIGAHAAPAATAPAEIVTTTPLAINEAALAIAGIGMSSNVTAATLMTEGFRPLQMFVGNASISGAAAYSQVEAGTYDVSWQLSSPQVWSAGIVALRRL